MSGSGRVKLDNEVLELGQWDVVRVAKETMRAFEAGPEGAELVVFGAGEREEPNMTPGWWSD